jgi:rare lipoprotein A
MCAGNRILRTLGVIVAALMLAAGCATTPSPPPPAQKKSAQKKPPQKKPAQKPAQKHDGGYYKDDGPGSTPPSELAKIPDATPYTEPLRTRNNRPYRVHGKTYTPRTRIEPFSQRGSASWYGKRFHGRPTASGERYNMYAMTAAHPTLPIPSYARVTSLENGRSVVVRINDRGPFLRGRIIDLSYAAASKLGFINKGHAQVEVEQIVPGRSMPDEGPPGPMAAFREEAGGTAPTPSVEHSPAATPITSSEAVQHSNAGTASDGQRLFLQLGIFTSRENAESFRSRVSAQASDLTVSTEILPENAHFRVYTGPYASPAEARTAAGWIEERTGVQPFIVRCD